MPIKKCFNLNEAINYLNNLEVSNDYFALSNNFY